MLGHIFLFLALGYPHRDLSVVLCACFGVRVSVTFHLMFVHIIFSSVWVAEWPPFEKELLTVLFAF